MTREQEPEVRPAESAPGAVRDLPTIGERAPESHVRQSINGRETEIPLSSLWQQGPAVLVFLRHFG